MLTSAFRIGQSAIASEPSFIASVSRLGDATEPQSRWSRPMTIGAFTLPVRTSSLKRSPTCRALAVAEPADARRQALERDALLRQLDPAARGLDRSGTASSTACVGDADVLRIARQRDPAERALALAEQRADVRRHEARDVEGASRTPASSRLRADVVAVVEDVGARASSSSSIASTCVAIARLRALDVARRGRSRAARRPRRA